MTMTTGAYSTSTASSPNGQVATRTMSDYELVEDIHRLKREKNAIILAHYYQQPEIQELADFVGDSLGLAQAADKTGALAPKGERQSIEQRASVRGGEGDGIQNEKGGHEELPKMDGGREVL